MNIKQATEQVENAARAYLATDDNGLYLIPSQMQRPIILMGPPGVGKSAIVGQVAEHLGINFVSYSITHHTRQSALGLPYIEDADFDGHAYKVSRYTMSEIIAATYDAMEATGVREGILFLDEVNCVSETLAPAMLQFLQFKQFGQHRLPEGWVIVTAGNPPEYNRSARDFDPAMLDRMKRIDIEPDLDVWLDYAVSHGVHPAVTSYLQAKPDNFFRVRADVKGTRIVTARGWEDLSRMIVVFERENLEVSLSLVAQYLQDSDIAEDFALYYELFQKYQDDYKITSVLAGEDDPELKARVKAAHFDERLAFINLMLEALLREVDSDVSQETALKDTHQDLVTIKGKLEAARVRQAFVEPIHQMDEELKRLTKANASKVRLDVLAMRKSMLSKISDEAVRGSAGTHGQDAADAAWKAATSCFNEYVRALSGKVEEAADKLDHALDFLDATFGDGEEMLLFVSRLACDAQFMAFATAHGSHKFLEHSKGLMLSERGLGLLKEVDEFQQEEGATSH
ncbi:MAG: ATP-binding protein [Atopobiaceae bacterium]|jgi:hypothetical protein